MEKERVEASVQSVTETICPCCSMIMVELWDICAVCGWQNGLKLKYLHDNIGEGKRENLHSYQARWIESGQNFEKMNINLF